MPFAALTVLATLLAQEPTLEPPKRYGDQGTSHFGFALGLGSGSDGFNYAAGLDYGYFVVGGVAPGIELQLTGGSGLLTTGLTLGTLRLVPIRTGDFSFFVIGRAGRVFLSGHEDGFGAGGGAGIIFFMSRNFGLQLAYDYLHLFPDSFCADLSSECALTGLAVGVVAAF
jgi:hypothetical protein